MGRSGYTCVRHIFCVLNVILWLSGCGVIGVGVWLRLAYSDYTTLLPQYDFFNVDSLLVAIGLVMFSIAFFGCCGSWFESRCMLITYFSLVIFMFLVEFMCATLAFTFRENLSYTFREELKYGIEMHYSASEENGLHILWDKLHKEFSCCGVTDYEDWWVTGKREDEIKPSIKPPIKQSLYGALVSGVYGTINQFQYRNTTGCGTSGNPDHWYPNGCSDKVHMWFVERLHIIGAIGLVIAFIQLFGLLSSMLLFCTVRHKRTSSTYKSYNPST